MIHIRDFLEAVPRWNFIRRLLFVLLLVPLLTGALFSAQPRERTDDALEIRAPRVFVDGVPVAVELPTTLRRLPPRTSVRVVFDLQPAQGGTLFLHPVYSPLKVYVDDALCASFGEPGAYPAFFSDPPTGAFSVSVPLTDYTQTVRLEYQSPAARDSLYLYAPVLASERGVMDWLLDRYGAVMLLSLFFLTLGVAMSAASLLFLRFPGRGRLLRYPGGLAFSAGLWQLCENTLTVYLTDCPSLLYLLDFLGLFTLILPVYRQMMMILSLEKSRPLRFFLTLLEVSVLAAAALQLAGFVPFSRSMYFFHVLLPLALFVLAARVVWEAVRTRNRFAIGFSLALSVMTAGAVLELLNYYLRFFIISAAFQQGLCLFILICAALSLGYMREIFAATQKNLELQSELALLSRSIDAQKEKTDILLEHAEEVRRQRHDLRQHLSVMLRALDDGRYDELRDYIRELHQQIPYYKDMSWCEHPVVNALLSYYVAAAEAEDVLCDIRAQIPDNLPHISNSSLCVLIGNLLENALDACKRMSTGDRYLTFRARVQGEMLSVTVDNTYNGQVKLYRGQFVSSKRDAIGTGLRSVENIAARHGGAASFEPGETMFRSSVYIRI